ncbi:hypothetical protein ACYFX5_15300 [Bremerella sp. T1]|uniref:hypothetical protein n=1 Tax=Bremerella sp. TYQ1 TaxID=3119568 RepID=UPI001CC903A0|nr:hypothetical protein [Bremerella volcania]UBM34423.1 hypothetical protein LA756_17250 [Bremerella volcania]
MNARSDNPFQSPKGIDQDPPSESSTDESNHQMTILLFITWCLFMLVASLHFGMSWVERDVLHGVLFCLTGIVGIILIIPTPGTRLMAILYAASVVAYCGTFAAMQEKGYQTVVLLSFLAVYAIMTALLVYIGNQERKQMTRG